jgi:hypothetical protein
MDAKLNSYQDETTKNNYVDFYVDDNGCVPMITGDEEEEQNAQFVTFIKKNNIPQLSGNEHGVDWLGFVTGETKFGEIDAQIRDNINFVDLTDKYYPSYSIVNEKLKLEVIKQ